MIIPMKLIWTHFFYQNQNCLFLVINIYFLIVIINSFNMNSLRQYTQSDEVFPIQNLLEKIGMSGGEKKKTCCNELRLYSQVDRCHAIWLGWDHTPYMNNWDLFLWWLIFNDNKCLLEINTNSLVSRNF